jgi:hypothetical protein
VIHVEERPDVAEPVVDDGDHRIIAGCRPSARITWVPSVSRPMLLL